MRQESLRLTGLASGHVIDTSALVDLHRVHYAPDIFKTLWTRLSDLAERHVLLAPRQVYVELKQRDDDLLRWAKQHKTMFRDPDSEQQAVVREIVERFPKLVDVSKTTEDADPFAIALAEVGKHSVVGSEQGGKQGHTHIPDVCHARGVRCVDLLGMFRDLKWSF